MAVLSPRRSFSPSRVPVQNQKQKKDKHELVSARNAAECYLTVDSSCRRISPFRLSF